MDRDRPGEKRTRQRRRSTGHPQLGLRVRKFREAHGLSREQLAHQVERSEGWLYLVETGESDPGYSDLVHLAQVLRIDPVRLLVGDRDAAAESQQPALDVADGAILDDVQRRAFERLLLFGIGAAAVGLDHERLASILAGTRTDTSALDDMETLTSDLVRQETILAPDSLLPAVRGHLQGITGVLVWTPAKLAPRAYSLAGQTALLAGYLMFKQGRHTDADTYWSLADRFGGMAGDIRLRAALLVLQAYRWQDQDLPRTLTLYDRAAAILGPAPDPAVAALVLAKRAPRRAEASHADATYATLALRDIDSAHSYAGGVEQPDNNVYVWESLTGNLIERRAETLLHLDRPHEAATEFERALASMDPSWLSARSGGLAYIAAARARCGDPEHASVLLSSALGLAAEASSSRHIERVRSYRHRWVGGYDGPAARRLDEQLGAIAPR
jgi:transcriptional regulator with XRE-family HTH domain